MNISVGFACEMNVTSKFLVVYIDACIASVRIDELKHSSNQFLISQSLCLF